MKKSIKLLGIFAMLSGMATVANADFKEEVRSDGVPVFQRSVEIIIPQFYCNAHKRTQFSIFLHHKGEANLDPIEVDSVQRSIKWSREFFGQDSILFATIDAYADTKNKNEENNYLSDKRAYAVLQLVEAEEIPLDNITIASYGQSNKNYKQNDPRAGATHLKVHVISREDYLNCQNQYPENPLDLEN